MELCNDALADFFLNLNDTNTEPDDIYLGYPRKEHENDDNSGSGDNTVDTKISMKEDDPIPDEEEQTQTPSPFPKVWADAIIRARNAPKNHLPCDPPTLADRINALMEEKRHRLKNLADEEAYRKESRKIDGEVIGEVLQECEDTWKKKLRLDSITKNMNVNMSGTHDEINQGIREWYAARTDEVLFPLNRVTMWILMVGPGTERERINALLFG